MCDDTFIACQATCSLTGNWQPGNRFRFQVRKAPHGGLLLTKAAFYISVIHYPRYTKVDSRFKSLYRLNVLSLELSSFSPAVASFLLPLASTFQRFQLLRTQQRINNRRKSDAKARDCRFIKPRNNPRLSGMIYGGTFIKHILQPEESQTRCATLRYSLREIYLQKFRRGENPSG